MQALLHKTILNIITQMLFSKRYFSEDDFYNKKGKEFNDVMANFMHIAGIFNISDYIPYLKPFDLQGVLPQAKHIFMEFDQFFDKIIHEHLNEQQADKPKDIVDVLLSLPAIEDFGDRLDDNRIKAILHVMFTLPHVDCNFNPFKGNLCILTNGILYSYFYKYENMPTVPPLPTQPSIFSQGLTKR